MIYRNDPVDGNTYREVKVTGDRVQIEDIMGGHSRSIGLGYWESWVETTVFPPSETAIRRATNEAYGLGWGYTPDNARSAVEKILLRIHHPDLGLDRSVRLGDVVDALRHAAWGRPDHDDPFAIAWEDAANWIEDKFIDNERNSGDVEDG